MVLMALDHVRDFIHHDAMAASPTDLARTTVGLFVTRWVTHVCAPVFIFTAGLGAFFWWQRGHSRAELARFLATRGLWLVLLELTVMRLAYNFTLAAEYPVLLLVLWVLGVSMIALAAFVWLPRPALLWAALVTMVLHNVLDPVRASTLGAGAGVWFLLHQVGAFRLGELTFIVGYPLVPWVAVMALGFACGPVLQRAPEARQRILLRTGLVATTAFVMVRVANGYGDPAPWAPQPTPAFTLLSFLNTTKYPPSLAFLLMTLGPALVGLAWLDRVRLPSTHPLVVFGRAPLFFFVAHFFLAHLVSVMLAFARYGDAAWAFVFHPVPSMGGPRTLYPPDFGSELWLVYLVWVGVVLALYPGCRQVAAWKAGRREWWISYL